MSVGRLVICPTPIGNLGDVTQRCLDALKSADVVCAEDTRVTSRLLAAYQISKRIERLDEERISSQAALIAERVLAGEVIAYCSDAGMPGISDPGGRLVQAARDCGATVEVLPGPSASITAYVASGFSCPRFYFGGFFPRKHGDQTALLDTLARLDAVLIFFESPHRLVASLEAVATRLPDRKVTICRELTKLHEEVLCAPAAEACDQLRNRTQNAPLKGELVLVIDAPKPDELAASVHDAERQAYERAFELAALGGISAKDLTKRLQEEYAIPRNTAYTLAINAGKRKGVLESAAGGNGTQLGVDRQPVGQPLGQPEGQSNGQSEGQPVRQSDGQER